MNTLKEIFEGKFTRRSKNNCWLWEGSRQTNGYGRIGFNKKYYKAHRLSYAFYKGDVPNDLEVCHKCDNPPCINPNHLFLVTHQENIQNMIDKGRSNFVGSPPGEKAGSTKLTDKQVREIRAKYKPKIYNMSTLAKQYKVSKVCIFLILKRKNWKHLN